MKNIEILETKKPVNYQDALIYMEKKISLVKNNTSKELIWLLEHPSIYTTGRGYHIERKSINKIPLYNTGRGGKITWHGPGQRVVYFIINLKKRNIDIRRFVNNIENLIIKSLKELKINAYKRDNMIGIWTLDKDRNDAKIGSLGLRVSKGIIYHGLSLNVSCNLSPFYNIEVCGVKNPKVTSINDLLGFIDNKFVDRILKNNLNLLFL